MRNAKLFIWTGTKENGREPYEWGKLEIRDVNTSVARCVSGGG